MMIPFLFFVYSILEGDNVREITIQILGLGLCHEGCVSIRDSHGKLLCESKTVFGRIKVSLKPKNIYLLSFHSFRGVFRIPFYVDCKRDCYYFEWPMRRPIERIITFQLTDANYMNLPIEKGEIIVE